MLAAPLDDRSGVDDKWRRLRGPGRQHRTISLRTPLRRDEGDGAPEPPRPVVRGECVGAPRPCPYVGCRYHLYLDVHPRTGSIKYNFPHLEPHELPYSCALDVADLGGLTLENVGELTNLTRERIRQVETMARNKLRRKHPIMVIEFGQDE